MEVINFAETAITMGGGVKLSWLSPNSTWLVTSRHDTFDVSNPCILAVSSLSNSTARHGRHDELDWLDTIDTLVSTRSTRRTRRVVSRRDETSGKWGLYTIRQ